MATVLITGTSSGLGVALVAAFLSRGDTVIATMRKLSRSGKLLEEVDGRGLGAPDVVALDVTDPTSRERAVEEVLARHGAIDVVVNNAGMCHVSALEDTPEAVTRRLFETNVFGPNELVRLVLPHMRSRGEGRVVNVTAIGAVLCTPYLGQYVASKHALDAITAALDLEVRHLGLRAVSVLPGSFPTAIVSNAATPAPSEGHADRTERFAQGFADRIAGSSTTVDEVAATVVEAAVTEDPPPRFLVGGRVIESLRSLVASMNDLHEAEAARLRG